MSRVVSRLYWKCNQEDPKRSVPLRSMEIQLSLSEENHYTPADGDFGFFWKTAVQKPAEKGRAGTPEETMAGTGKVGPVSVGNYWEGMVETVETHYMLAQPVIVIGLYGSLVVGKL